MMLSEAELSESAMRLLEGLTPGGSEFVQDPKRCAEWVRDRLAVTASLALRAKKAEADLTAARDEAEQMRAVGKREGLEEAVRHLREWAAKGEERAQVCSDVAIKNHVMWIAHTRNNDADDLEALAIAALTSPDTHPPTGTTTAAAQERGAPFDEALGPEADRPQGGDDE